MSHTANLGGLPHGMGYLHRRGRIWWMSYRDIEGNRVQESTGTSDEALAKRMLVGKAIAKLEQQLAELKEIGREKAQAKGHGKAGAGRSRGAGKDHPRAARNPRNRTAGSEGGTR